MRYEEPRIQTVDVNELLTELGPARAWGYFGFGDDENCDEFPDHY